MNVKDFIANKKLMNEFVNAANASLKNYGSLDDVYYYYQDKFGYNEFISDDMICCLLNYCKDNDLLEQQDYKFSYIIFTEIIKTHNMKKALNTTQTIIESIVGSAVLALIVLSIMMALSSCGSQKQYAKSKHDWMTKKKYDTAKHKSNKSYTCYEWQGDLIYRAP